MLLEIIWASSMKLQWLIIIIMKLMLDINTTIPVQQQSKSSIRKKIQEASTSLLCNKNIRREKRRTTNGPVGGQGF